MLASRAHAPRVAAFRLGAHGKPWARGFRRVSAYLDIAGFKLRSILPAVDIDSEDSAFVDLRLGVGSSEIDGMLRKRYAAPFAAPVPEVVLGWLAAITTPDVLLRRGWDPGTDQAKSIVDAAALARSQIKEAADSKDGLWDLPLRADVTSTGISKGGPLGYAEADPYAWRDIQTEAVRGR